MESKEAERPQLCTYLYKGIPFEESVSPRVRVEAIESYKDLRDDDVIVCTFPKAGTHWAAEIARKVLCEGDLSEAHKLSTDAYFELSPPPGVKKGDRGYMPRSLEELSELPSPRVIHTHLLLSMLPSAVFQKRTRVIYVYRNPRDIAVSFYHWAKHVTKVRGINLDKTWQEFFDIFMKGETAYGSWQTHYKDFQENSHRVNCLILKYEDMKKDLRSAVSSVAEFLGKTVQSKAIEEIVDSCTFESMKARHHLTALFRKGTIGDWKNTFTVEQSERMTETIRRAKEEMGLRIDYE